MSTTDRRGAERFAVDLASRLRSGDRPQSVVALTAGSSGGLGVPALGPGRFAPATLGALRDRIQGSSVVVAHGSSTLPAVAATAAGTGVPFVYRSIGDPRAWVTTRARRHRVGLAARRAAAVVALWPGSAVTWHEMLGVPAERLTIIPNAVDAGRFRPADPHERRDARAHLGLPADARVVACIGALAPEKRVDLAVEAVAAMDGVHLVVAGDGPCREAVSRRAAAVGHGRIHLLGHRSDPGSVLAAADVVVVPSATEGQPAVAVEAGLCGLPVVATRVGGLPSIVVDGSTGVLVAPGRADDLSRGISAALATGPTLGRAARDHCRARFDLAVVIPAWRRLLGDVVTSG